MAGVAARTASAQVRILVLVAAAMFNVVGCESDDDADDKGAARPSSSGAGGSQATAGSAVDWEAEGRVPPSSGPISGAGSSGGNGQATGVGIDSTPPPPGRVASPYVVDRIALHECGRMLPSCGGDVAGTWNVVTYCQIGMLEEVESLWPSRCYDVLRSYEWTVEGTITFGSGGELDLGLASHGTSRVVINQSCARALGASSGLTETVCEQDLEHRIETSAPYRSADCLFGVDTCICELTAATSVVKGLRYSLSDDDELTIGSRVVPYCVDGDTLNLELVDELGVTFELVLSRGES